MRKTNNNKIVTHLKMNAPLVSANQIVRKERTHHISEAVVKQRSYLTYARRQPGRLYNT